MSASATQGGHKNYAIDIDCPESSGVFHVFGLKRSYEQ